VYDSRIQGVEGGIEPKAAYGDIVMPDVISLPRTSLIRGLPRTTIRGHPLSTWIPGPAPDLTQNSRE